MASGTDSDGEQVVPHDEEEESDVRAVQAHYLRSPSPSQYSLLSDTYTESIFMEPIHLSSSVAAKQIINEELKSKEVKPLSVNEDMWESAEQLMVEDLYNRIKEKIDDRSVYNTPCILDLQRILMQDRMESPMNAVDEVWPNVFIAEKSVAVNKGRLKRMGISNILNAGHGTGVFTGREFYSGMDIHYLGIEVDDFPDCDISKYLRKGAEFLDEALLTYRGKALVNSVMGISRSAVIVAAYLMIFHHMTILQALMTIRKKRAIYPNDGFLKQLRELNETLLEEREEFEQEESDNDDTTSQGSVVEARAHSIMVQEEDTGSLMGAKAHSITVHEEEAGSVMGSVMSSAANSSVVSKQPTLIDEDEEEKLYEEWRIKQGLPPREHPKESNEFKELKMSGQSSEEEEDLHKMVFEWQRRNEKYQSGVSDDEDGESLMGGRRYSPSVFSDVESVSSADIQMLKQQLVASGINRARRGRADSESTEDSTWNIWTQRIQEIEKEAVKRSCAMDTGADGSSGSGKKERDIDEESLFSETNSLYNFCKKNKDKLTALERWKIKRIQYGLHKKDSETTENKENTSREQGANEGEVKEKELTESNLTAYQAWKMKRQQKLGTENKDEIVELAKGEGSTSAKRKQRREEILERSKKTLEESQSLLGWETESAMSGSIPLAAFLPSMPPGFRADDSASVFSMQSNRSCLSQARGTPGIPQAPTIPQPNITPVAGDAISMASIQNWIANVVTETIAQKQNEILMMSRAPSVMSTSTRSVDHGRNTEDDKMSLLSMQSGSALASSLLRQRDTRNMDNQSAMSFDSSASLRTEGSGIRRKVTETSKPLFSLFADDINLKELNKKEKEIKTELSGKMAEYKREKITTDNKRSTLFKKKKAKDDEDEEDEEEAANTRLGSYRHLSHLDTERVETSSAFSGSFSKGLRSSVESNVEKWLSDLKTDGKTSQPNGTENTGNRYTSRACTREETSSDRLFRSRAERPESSSASYQPRSERHRETTDFSSTTRDVDKGDNRCTPSKFREITRPRNDSPEPFFSRKSPDATSRLDTPESTSTYNRAHHFEASESLLNGDVSELGAKRKFNQSFARDAEEAKEDNNGEDGTDPLGRWAQCRKSPDVAEDKDDDDIIAAWRDKQEETKAKLLRRRRKD